MKSGLGRKARARYAPPKQNVRAGAGRGGAGAVPAAIQGPQGPVGVWKKVW